MLGNPARRGPTDPAEPVLHDLPSIRYGGNAVPVRLAVRHDEQGTWLGRLIFGPEESDRSWSTAEIFCGSSEEELWEFVRDLGEHHLRDLYRSLSE